MANPVFLLPREENVRRSSLDRFGAGKVSIARSFLRSHLSGMGSYLFRLPRVPAVGNKHSSGTLTVEGKPVAVCLGIVCSGDDPSLT
jgi:hypothetical protein